MNDLAISIYFGRIWHRSASIGLDWHAAVVATRDDEMLHSGPRFTAGPDFFQVDGKPAAIVGTTYMSSDVQRQFLVHPNPFVWDRDMHQITDSGLNLLRTGLWSGWRDVTNDDGTAKEFFLRNLEAYLLTARRHNLSVQFTFFSFLPEAFGGANPYLDPISVERQQNLSSLAPKECFVSAETVELAGGPICEP